MEIEKLHEKLSTLEMNETFQYPINLPPAEIDKILAELGIDSQVGEDWNGWELDWSKDFEINEIAFHVWGSAYSGSMCFKKD